MNMLNENELLEDDRRINSLRIEEYRKRREEERLRREPNFERRVTDPSMNNGNQIPSNSFGPHGGSSQSITIPIPAPLQTGAQSQSYTQANPTSSMTWNSFTPSSVPISNIMNPGIPSSNFMPTSSFPHFGYGPHSVEQPNIYQSHQMFGQIFKLMLAPTPSYYA